MKTLVLMTGLLFLLAGCGDEKVEVQKSPCAGLAGSPCGPKRPVNGKLNTYHLQPESGDAA